ncbi:hypothetical protein EUGRSUZ_J02471 [Eucalyptus grandis]|uniref:Uncharacterized protein n=2 Tax=Eucalyptus grandis TaxID=71139 RepID=A0ACC3J8Z5_EUCGR|nr:hypothetical protein EUGRSUZ_J02471 [Eucalyptus grandis]
MITTGDSTMVSKAPSIMGIGLIRCSKLSYNIKFDCDQDFPYAHKRLLSEWINYPFRHIPFCPLFAYLLEI